MSIDRETNRTPAYVSFRGVSFRGVSFRGRTGLSDLLATQIMTSGASTSNAVAADMFLFAGLADTRIPCESERDLYPPSCLPGYPPSPHVNTR